MPVQGLVIEVVGLIVGVILILFVAPILAFCLVPIPAFFVGALVTLYRFVKGS